MSWLRREPRIVSDIIIRPTTKYLRLGTILAATVFLGLEIVYLVTWRTEDNQWLMILPPLILLWPASRWVRRQSARTIINGDRLRYETGLAAKSTRTIQLTKVQDVRVDQSIVQRMFNVGNVSIETAGEASRLTLVNVDNPQGLADDILNRAHLLSSGSLA
jgi:uncharacterized membrane protein YdbT with pleckstrin-like domain